VLSTVVPAAVFVVVQFMSLRAGAHGAHDLHHSFLALFSVHALGQLLTQAMKVLVGRHRPNYYKWTERDGNVRDAHLSFPSGHSSVTFEGFVLLSLYICGKFRVYNSARGRPFWMLLVSVIPLLVPIFVSISRYVDSNADFDVKDLLLTRVFPEPWTITTISQISSLGPSLAQVALWLSTSTTTLH
jgi:diacylglycerol diphosphate phosphatase / phosphatidate phosphatase